VDDSSCRKRPLRAHASASSPPPARRLPSFIEKVIDPISISRPASGGPRRLAAARAGRAPAGGLARAGDEAEHSLGSAAPG